MSMTMSLVRLQAASHTQSADAAGAQAEAMMRAELAQARAEGARAQAELGRAQAEMKRAVLEAQLAGARAGRSVPGFAISTPPRFPTPSRRQEAMMFVGFLVVTMAAVAILQPIARAIGRRLEGGRATPLPDRETAAQLQRIEQAVDAMSVEIERLSEGQRFTTKLLANRAEAESLIPRR